MHTHFIAAKNLNASVVKKLEKNYMYQFHEDMLGKRKIKEHNVNSGNNHCPRYSKIAMTIKHFQVYGLGADMTIKTQDSNDARNK